LSTSNDDGLEALRKYLAAGSTLSGLPKPHWPEPPNDARGLRESDPAKRAGQRPAGLMLPYVGARIDVGSRARPDMLDDVRAEALLRVCAWPVLPLQGASFHVTCSEDIGPGIRALVAALLPGIDLWIPEHWAGPFEKYGIVHNTFAAPPNEATGEAMAIELFGEAEHRIDLSSAEYRAAMLSWFEQGPERAKPPTGVRLPTAIRITVATYSNVGFPGVGTPFYM
jgi:hypothetical protein